MKIITANVNTPAVSTHFEDQKRLQQAYEPNPSLANARATLGRSIRFSMVPIALLAFCLLAASAFSQTLSNSLTHGPVGELKCRTCGDPPPDPTPTPIPPLAPAPEPGYMHPKYVVMGVTYAPPGAKSSVNYGSSTMLGTSTSLDQTFTFNASLSLSVTSGVTIFGVGADLTGTASGSYAQEADASSSVAINNTTSNSTIVPGPGNSALGIDHDYDIVWVWLNPMVNITITPPSTLRWTGYSYDMRDPSAGMDVVPLYLIWLKNPSTMPANVASRCSRVWDTSGLGGLTNADYTVILARDPFSNAAYNPSMDTSGRFDLAYGSTFTYEPPPAGGQPATETFSLVSQTTSTFGRSAKDTYSVNTSLEAKATSGFLLDIKAVLKQSDTLTWANKSGITATTSIGQTATLSLTGPAFSDNYTGPTQMQVWKDNVYGSFMFYPVQ